MTSIPIPHTIESEIDNNNTYNNDDNNLQESLLNNNSVTLNNHHHDDNGNNVNNKNNNHNINPNNRVNFSGKWELILDQSDSINSLMSYHGLKEDRLLKAASSRIPILYIQQTKHTISTKIFTKLNKQEIKQHEQNNVDKTSTSFNSLNKDDIINNGNNNNNIINPSSNNENEIYISGEEYLIDGHYHTVKIKQQGTQEARSQSRCYYSPHGKSLIVDTRCANPYDLERTERYLSEDGNQMILEVRILSCDPAKSNTETQSNDANSITTGVASPFAQQVSQQPVMAANNVVVVELLCIKRVFKRIH